MLIFSGLGDIYGKKGATIAGYGKFTRSPCMTDKYGDYKFHYCSEESKCDNRYSFKFLIFSFFCKILKCYKIKHISLNILSTSPPSLPACKKFFDHKDTPNSIPSDVTDVIVSDEDGDHYCYREMSPQNGSWGWCYIDWDATDMRLLPQSAESWGFCSKDCFLHNKGTWIYINMWIYIQFTFFLLIIKYNWNWNLIHYKSWQ